MWGRLKFMYEVPHLTAQNGIALNWYMQSKTKACIANMPCADKTDNTAWLKLTDTNFFLRTLFIIQFFKEAYFGSQLHFCLPAKKHLTWWNLTIKLFLVTGHHTVNLLRYASQNRSSPRVVTRLKYKISTNQQIKNNTNNHELWLIRLQTHPKIKNTCI